MRELTNTYKMGTSRVYISEYPKRSDEKKGESFSTSKTIQIKVKGEIIKLKVNATIYLPKDTDSKPFSMIKVSKANVEPDYLEFD